MKAKSSAHYQREFRKRMRDQGLVKKEVWIQPEYAKQLSAVEKKLRLSVGEASTITLTEGDVMAGADKQWTTESLFEALIAEDLFQGLNTVELIDGVSASLHIVMHDYGDLPVFLTVSGDQIIAEAVLWPLSDVQDIAGFNDAVLRTHKYFPLSTISLEANPGDEDYYVMFGALSSSSILPNILLEIEMLASNVLQATEAYSDYINLALKA